MIQDEKIKELKDKLDRVNDSLSITQNPKHRDKCNTTHISSKKSYILIILSLLFLVSFFLGMIYTNPTREKFNNKIELRIREILSNQINDHRLRNEFENYITNLFIERFISHRDYLIASGFTINLKEIKNKKKQINEIHAWGFMGLITIEDEDSLNLIVRQIARDYLQKVSIRNDISRHPEDKLEELEHAARIAKLDSKNEIDRYELKDGEKCERLSSELQEAYDFFNSIRDLSQIERERFVKDAIGLRAKSIEAALDTSLKKLENDIQGLKEHKKMINTFRLREMPIAQFSFVGCKFVSDTKISREIIMSTGFDRCMRYINASEIPSEKCFK